MSDVQRFGFEDDEVTWGPMPHGAFVSARDYDRLAAELEAERVRRIRAEDACEKDGKARAEAGGMSMEIDELRAELSAARADAERIRYLAAEPFCDEYGGIDLHEQASIYASALGREEPNTDDYVAAVRDAIDAARAAPSAGVPRSEPQCPVHGDPGQSHTRATCTCSAGPALSGMQVVIDPTMPEGTAELRCGESRVPIVPSARRALDDLHQMDHEDSAGEG